MNDDRNGPDMSPQEFRLAGTRAIDWIARYLAHPEDYPVLSRTQPGAIRASLPDRPPEMGEAIDTILEDFEQTLLPGVTHWNHPGFFAYFGITGSGPGVLGELLCAALNVNAMLWRTSPAATELEEVALGWLRQMVDLPDTFEGVIMDTASVATLCAVAAARHAQRDLEIRERGTAGRPELPGLYLYTSEEAHSSVEKAAIVLGLGRRSVRKIPVDDDFRLSVPRLEAAVQHDLERGGRPFCVVATVGTTSTTSIDPVARIADLCDAANLWLHVDAAYAGPAAIVPELRHVLDGCERADSIVLNPHKWLFTPIDCSAFYTQKPDVLTGAFSVVPEYLRTPDSSGSTRNYMDYGIQLGRRFRALKLWMVLRYFGTQGIADRIREHVRLAKRFADRIDDHPDFERLAPRPLSVVCFRARPRPLADRSEELDRFNELLLDRVNASGEVYLSHTRLGDSYALRLAVGNLRTTERHVDRAWQILERAATELLARDH